MIRVYRLALTILLTAAAARAQTPPPRTDWEHATELAGLAAVASSANTWGAAPAGVVRWDLTPHVTIEGRGVWLDRGIQGSAFAGDLSALVRVGPKRQGRPYLGGGFGLYRASFEPASQGMPRFYRDRATSAALEGGRGMTFTDPAVRLATGVELTTRRHVTVRPEASVLLVWRGNASQTVIMTGVLIGYRFEDHPVTPRSR